MIDPSGSFFSEINKSPRRTMWFVRGLKLVILPKSWQNEIRADLAHFREKNEFFAAMRLGKLLVFPLADNKELRRRGERNFVDYKTGKSSKFCLSVGILLFERQIHPL